MIGFSYEKQKFETNIDLKFNGIKKLKNYNLSEGIDNIEQTPFLAETGEYYGSPSWATINLNTKYRFTENLDLRVSVNNILDQHYKEFASSISAPGRNFSFSILANF
jgi:hemoglobin/transferrin/lactoferrin receptor protein